MVSMDALPVELLRLILSNVHGSEEGVAHLTKALRVCKRWNRAGHALLWRTVFLHGANTRLFLRSASPSRRSLIRNLTLSASVIKKSFRKKRSRKTALRNEPRSTSRLKPLDGSSFRQLIEFISQADHLATISLYDSKNVNSLPKEPEFLSHFRIRQFLDHLPASVKNLEIDIWDYQETDIEAQNCLCSAVARVLPRLEHLRLRTPMLCPSLLTPSPMMKSLTINISWTEMYHDCCCRHIHRRPFDQRKDGSPIDDRTLFVTAAESMLIEHPDLFPAIQKFSLVSTYNFDEDWCGPSHLLLNDDFLNSKTTAYPLWCINEEAPLGDELWALRVRESNDSNDRDIIGSSEVVEAFVENSVWSADTHDARYVSVTSKSDNEQPISQIFKDQFIKARSQSTEVCGIWRHEQLANVSLLAPQVVKLGDTPTLDLKGYGGCPDDIDGGTHDDSEKHNDDK